MKPVKLVISGWGPYKEKEEIDFEMLSKRGIFLITGQTGAGKTTIFDAITYALYGDLSGNLRQKGTVRSDFADAQTRTYVEFAMDHNGQRYRIRRNPEYQRPSRRKGTKLNFTTEKENAVLWFSDGRTLEGNREVNEKIREILQLDLRQFQQISMIAQGEFAQLLHAGGEEKMKIFREIFGTSIYDLFLKKLKERASAAEKRATEFLHRMEEDVRLCSAEDERLTALTEQKPYPYREIAALLLTMEKEAESEAQNLEARKEMLEEEIHRTTTQLALAERINQRFKELENLSNRQKLLLEKQEEMKRLEDVCLKAAAAAKVYEVYRQLTLAKADIDRQKKQLDDQKKQLEAMQKEQEAFRPAAEKEAKLEELFELREAVKRAQEQYIAVTSTLERYRQQLEEAQQAYLQAEDQVQALQHTYDTMQRARQHSMIGLVASMVQEGEPCPVCGSIEHPRIAAGQEGPDEKQLKEAENKLEAARKTQLKHHGEARAALEVYDKQNGEADQAKRAFETAQDRAAQQEKQLEEIRIMFGAWPQRVEFRQKMRRYHETEAAITEKQKVCQQIEENKTLIAARGKELQTQLEEQKLQQGFSQDEDWKAALLDEETLGRQQKQLADYREELKVCQELIRHLQTELEGKLPVDTAQQKELCRRQQEENQELSRKLQKQRLTQHAAGRTGRSLMENQKKSQEAQAIYGVVKDLENMASGNNPRRLVFEQYVLAGYFDDILRAANLRLKNMSGGRYELFRADKISDGRKKDSLEIEVMDYYTGRKRSVRTLSGGETFKASLALALGLSDAVCAASGGVKVDTLFIDEGFGALDAQSLDQACTTLMALAGENRLIGIISHIGELKERISSQIIVEKETVGSRIRIKEQ